MNAWYVFGAILAAWALIVSFLGITRENFPGSRSATLVVGAISVILAILAIGAAVYSGITEAEDEGEGHAAAALTA